MREITEIIVHSSDSPNLLGDRRLDTAEDVHRWHKQKGWAGIGYHWVIDETGSREAGRPMYWQGAHAKGHNKHSIGICLIGKDEFNDAQIQELSALVVQLKEQFPSAKVIGHRDVNPNKTCPGFDVAEWYERLQSGY